jgi:flagellar basal body-associated protein FliL
MIIILLLVISLNINLAYAEGEAAPESTGNATIAYPYMLNLKELYLPLNQRPDAASSNMVRMSLSLELNDNTDYPGLEKKTEQIQELVANYLLNASADDLTNNDGIYKIKMDLLAQINELISSIKIKAIYLNDITVQ